MANGLPFIQGEQGNRSFGQFRMMGTAGKGAQNAGVVMGEIISKDEKSLTVKLPDGGSKIVFFSSSTEVGKTATTTPEFLSAGQSIVASGSANSDGSINAQNIQVRPQIGIVNSQK
jgi:cytochrome c-type biogenesis protein CcmE